VKPRLEEETSQRVQELSQLKHRVLVRLLGCSYLEPYLCVVAEYCSGGSLQALLHSPERDHDSLSYRDCLDICQVCVCVCVCVCVWERAPQAPPRRPHACVATVEPPAAATTADGSRVRRTGRGISSGVLAFRW